MDENTMLDKEVSDEAGEENENVASNNPFSNLLLILISAIVGLAAGYLVGLGGALIMIGEGVERGFQQLGTPENNPAMRWPLIFLQGVVSLTTFLIFPLFLSRYKNYLNLNKVFAFKEMRIHPMLVLLGITILTMAFASVLAEWSQLIELPEALSWLKNKDAEIEMLTAFLTSFDSFSYFLVCFLVIAIIPAVAEEFLFRALIQKQLIEITKNAHIGIWFTAMVFSAMHMQFLGFLPRMFIGLILGYIYLWRGSLIYPIFIHLVNNGLTVVLLYLYQRGLIETDVEEATVPHIATFIIPVLLMMLLVYYKRLTSRYSTYG